MLIDFSATFLHPNGWHSHADADLTTSIDASVTVASGPHG
jgi:hypothetical protein